VKTIRSIFLALFAAPLLLYAAEPTRFNNTTCPVMGGNVNGKDFVVHNGVRYELCCPGCEKTFAQDPAKYLAKLPNNGAIVALGNTRCPVSDKPVVANEAVVVNGVSIGLCCPKCAAAVTKEPEKYLQRARASAPQAATETARGDMRIDYQKIAPGVGQAMMGLENYVRSSGLEKPLLVLVKMRASQINGCAYCLDLHAKEATALGKLDEKMAALADWRNATVFTARERAALAWTEALTLIASHHVTEEFLNETRKQFSDKELVDLSLAIISINGWNRLNISFRSEPESCPVD